MHSRLASLAESGRIERDQLDAAATWGQWAERVGAPITAAWRLRVDGGALGGDGGLTSRELEVAGRLRASSAALGAARCALLHACVVEDQSWRQIGQWLGVAGDTVGERVVEAIQALALWLDGDGITVESAKESRGDRPWVPHPRPKRDPATPTPRSAD